MDLCVDTSDNYSTIPSEPCAFIDVLGVSDEDNDGICDDVDTCVGIEDECGVCNGPGPTEIVIDQIITTYDSSFSCQLTASGSSTLWRWTPSLLSFLRQLR